MRKRSRLLLALLVGFAPVGCDDSDDVSLGIGARNRTSAILQDFSSCEDLHTALKGNLSEKLRSEILSRQNSYWGRGGMMEDAAPANGASANDSAGGGAAESREVSTTNNQEAGVDEADFVKWDKFYMYLINGHRLEIMGMPEVGKLTKVSSTELEGSPFQMLIFDEGSSVQAATDRLVVFSNLYAHRLPEDHPLRGLMTQVTSKGGIHFRTHSMTKITVFDIGDRAKPTVHQELFIEGHYQTARLVESTVRMVNHGWLDLPGIRTWVNVPSTYWDLESDDPRRDEIWQEEAAKVIEANDVIIATMPLSSFLPRIYQRKQDGALIEHDFAQGDCSNFSIPRDGMAMSLTSIMSLNLLSEVFAFDADHIVSNWSTVYASQNVMLIAEPSHEPWWFWRNDTFEEATNIHRFDISEVGNTTYTGSGRVNGLIEDQFCLSEYKGNIRVATTTGRWGRWWLPVDEQVEPESQVVVLAGATSLEEIGKVGGLAPGERIWSARFVEDKAFVVTFRNIDPLWTIDLSNPMLPVVKGELHVPGVSTYIHPIHGDRLLNIGFGGDDEGLDWQTQVSLFDVSDFSQPRSADTLSFAPASPEDGTGWARAYSEATHEHKAFIYWERGQLLAIPLSTYRSTSNGGRYTYEFISRLQLVRVTDDSKLENYASIDHSGFFNADRTRYWSHRDVRRTFFMTDLETNKDYVYAISDRGVTAHLVPADTSQGLTLSSSLALPGSQDPFYWY